MKKILKLSAIAILFILLVLIRAYEESLFYDPLHIYFKGDYKNMPLPEMDFLQLQVNVLYRFLLNTAISLIIFWLVFLDKEILKLSIIIYAVLFVLLFGVFMVLVSNATADTSSFMLFYVRRFLIHPLFLLILLPAFYFQKYKFN